MDRQLVSQSHQPQRTNLAAGSAGKTRRDRKPRQAEARKPSHVWNARLLLAVGAIGAAVAAYLVATSAQRTPLPISAENRLDRVEPPPPEPPAEAWGPAYGPQATADELRTEARRVAEAVAGAYPQDAAALGVLARFRYALGESAEAVELWQRGVSLDPAYAEGHFGIGAAALRRGEFATAQESLQRAADLMPGDPRTATALAAAWLGLGRIEQAIAVLEKFVQAGPLSADAAIVLGQAYLEQQQYDKAQRLFEQVVRQAPREAKAYYGLARCCLRLGRRDEANQYMQRFQESQKHRVEEELRAAHAFSDTAHSRGLLVQTLAEAAVVYFRTGDAGQAERLWRSVAHLDPRDVASRRQLMQLYQAQDRSREALVVGEQLCGLEPANPELWFQLAVLHGVLEDFDAALAAANRALELDPHNERYRQARDLIRKGKGG